MAYVAPPTPRKDAEKEDTNDLLSNNERLMNVMGKFVLDAYVVKKPFQRRLDGY